MKYLIIFMFAMGIHASEACVGEEYVNYVAASYNIDLRTKSTKGWIRLLQNKDKYKMYKISDSDRLIILSCILHYYNSNPHVGRMT